MNKKTQKKRQEITSFYSFECPQAHNLLLEIKGRTYHFDDINIKNLSVANNKLMILIEDKKFSPVPPEKHPEPTEEIVVPITHITVHDMRDSTDITETIITSASFHREGTVITVKAE